jgi:uncharacterized protein YxjI
MHKLLNRNLYLVREHVGFFKAASNYDIFSPENEEMLMACREEKLGLITKILRFTDYKNLTPFEVEIKSVTGEKILTVKRGISFFMSEVDVLDENEKLVGKFKQKFFSLGGRFDLLDDNDRVLCTLQGNWVGWEFKFLKDGVELAQVTKKWAGVGKELLTTADNYILEIKNNVQPNDSLRILILAAVMCIDKVLKE